MSDEHEQMFNNDVSRITWVESQDLADIEYKEYCESLFKETEDAGLDPF